MTQLKKPTLPDGTRAVTRTMRTIASTKTQAQVINLDNILLSLNTRLPEEFRYSHWKSWRQVFRLILIYFRFSFPEREEVVDECRQQESWPKYPSWPNDSWQHKRWCHQQTHKRHSLKMDWIGNLAVADNDRENAADSGFFSGWKVGNS